MRLVNYFQVYKKNKHINEKPIEVVTIFARIFFYLLYI